MRQERERIVAYDMSTGPWDLHLVCADCGDEGHADPGAPALYEGEEWGGTVPACDVCGADIAGLKEVQS